MSDSAFDEERDPLIRRIINVTGDSISLLESNEMEVKEKVENEEWHEGDATHQENHATNGTDSDIHYCTVAKEPNRNAIKCGRNIVNCGSDAAQQPIAALKCEFDTTRCDNDSPKGHQHEISRSDASSDPKTCPSDQNQHKTDKHSLPNDQEDICCRDNMEKSSKSNDQCDHVNYDCKKQSIRKCDCHSPAAPECQCRAKVIDHNLVSKSDSSEKTNDSVENENSTASSDSVFCDCKSIMSSQRSSKIDLRADPTKGEEKSSKKLSHSTSDSTSICTYPTQSTLMEFCRICHCEGDTEIGPLIAPCYCRGSLRYVHQACLQQWIKSSDTKHCELCGYHFVMDSKLMPFHKWKKLSMSTTERRKIMFSVMFHVIAITCVIWSLYVLIERTANEIKVGKLQWPFWTKLVVVAIGFTGGLVFMYVQCKVYVQLWKRLKAHNRVIYVKNNSTDTDPPSDDEDSVQGSNGASTPQRQENDAVIVEIQS